MVGESLQIGKQAGQGPRGNGDTTVQLLLQRLKGGITLLKCSQGVGTFLPEVLLQPLPFLSVCPCAQVEEGLQYEIGFCQILHELHLRCSACLGQMEEWIPLWHKIAGLSNRIKRQWKNDAALQRQVYSTSGYMSCAGLCMCRSEYLKIYLDKAGKSD